jgi:dimethylhistidine N-methyltransferase
MSTQHVESVHDLHPSPDNMFDDVVRGLSAHPPMLPPKYFYDELGAALFDEITTLPEYYPTRTELDILEQNSDAIAAAIGSDMHVIEFGSGSGLKTRVLLRALIDPAAYSPIDISREQLLEFASELRAEFPDLEVIPVSADYSRDVTLPKPQRKTRGRVAFFPGSSIGNFAPAEATSFLRRVRNLCSGGALLIGVDLHKDTAVLEAAYDDGVGVTAAFNLNVLSRINYDLGADFDLGAFEHHAYYDEEQQRIEMRLVCTRACSVTIPHPSGGAAASFDFAPDTYITTEHSYKYTLDGFARMAQQAGWRTESYWTDARQWFSVWLLRACAGS